MKILLSNIKESSRDFLLEGPLTLESLEGRCGAGKVEAQVRVNPAGERWYVNGRVIGTFPFVCDRCGVSFEGELSGDFSLVVLSKQVAGLDPEDTGEVLILAGNNQEVDLSDKVQEALLLDLPIQLLCSDECKGLCAQCGADLNKGDCKCEDAVDPRWSALQDLKKMMESAEEMPEAGNPAAADESED